MKEELVIGLVSISDRASAGVYKDEGIPALKEWLTSAIAAPAWRDETRLIADEQARIEATLKELVDEKGCHLVLTTGGTGPAPRDVTPEATLAVAGTSPARSASRASLSRARRWAAARAGGATCRPRSSSPRSWSRFSPSPGRAP